MTLNRVAMTLALITALIGTDRSLRAQQPAESGYTNPLRLVRKYGRMPTSTHSQNNNSPRSLQQRGLNSAVKTDGVLLGSGALQQARHRQLVGASASDALAYERMRMRFSGRSDVSTVTGARVQRTYQAADNGAWFGQRTQAGRTANATRSQASTAGLTNQNMAHAANTRAFNKRFQNRTRANGAANFSELRSPVSRTGVDPRTLNARLGSSVRLPGGSVAAARSGNARIKRR